MSKILIISGLAGSGKDTFAKYLKDFSSKDIDLYAIAQPVKELVFDLFLFNDLDISDRTQKEKEKTFLLFPFYKKYIIRTLKDHGVIETDHLYNRKYVEDHYYKQFVKTVFGGSFLGFSVKKLSYRTAMQKVGTDFVRRKVKDEFWLEKIQDHLSEDSILVVTDGRFQNEIDYVRGIGGKVLHITTDSEFKKIESSLHESENGVKMHPHDYKFKNNHDDENWQDKMVKKAKQIIKKLCK